MSKKICNHFYQSLIAVFSSVILNGSLFCSVEDQAQNSLAQFNLLLETGECDGALFLNSETKDAALLKTVDLFNKMQTDDDLDKALNATYILIQSGVFTLSLKYTCDQGLDDRGRLIPYFYLKTLSDHKNGRDVLFKINFIRNIYEGTQGKNLGLFESYRTSKDCESYSLLNYMLDKVWPIRNSLLADETLRLLFSFAVKQEFNEVLRRPSVESRYAHSAASALDYFRAAIDAMKSSRRYVPSVGYNQSLKAMNLCLEFGEPVGQVELRKERNRKVKKHFESLEDFAMSCSPLISLFEKQDEDFAHFCVPLRSQKDPNYFYFEDENNSDMMIRGKKSLCQIYIPFIDIIIKNDAISWKNTFGNLDEGFLPSDIINMLKCIEHFDSNLPIKFCKPTTDESDDSLDIPVLLTDGFLLVLNCFGIITLSPHTLEDVKHHEEPDAVLRKRIAFSQFMANAIR